MDEDQYSEVHLVKLKLTNKNFNRVSLTCPFLQKFSPSVLLKTKSILYIPLINKITISKDLISHAKWQQIPINIQQMLEHPFDKHNIKVQTYDDEARIVKGEVINLQLQFSLFLTLKGHMNFIEIYFKHANLKKDPNVFRKMSPYVIVSTEQTKIKTRQVKDGHLNPRFQESVQVPFKSVFDKIVIQVKDKENSIGYETLYVFQLFGKSQQKELELKSQRKIIGSLIFMVQDFEPQDF